MRKFLLAAAIWGVAQGAYAADMPEFLRGSFPSQSVSTATRNWDGWYAGGQVGYSSADIDFGHAPKSLTNFMLRNTILQGPIADWSLLPKNHAQGTGFGGFVGRNYQWDDIVIGVEANYNYVNNLASATSGSMSRGIVNPPGSTPPTGHTYTYNMTLSGDAALQIKDVMTFRGRAGWAWGNFMPYMFGGVAVGRIAASRSATVSGELQDDYDVITTALIAGTPVNIINHQTDYSALPTLSQSEARSNSFVAGWTAGLGTEYMLWGNVFMRAEWEYVKFVSVKDISVGMNSVRAGIGYKF